MARPANRAVRSSPADVQAAIEAFLAAARQPVLQEPGERPFSLSTGSYALEQRAGALLLAAWDEERQLHRRISSSDAAVPGRLSLEVEKFGGRRGTLLLYDAAKASSEPLRKQAGRHWFREQLRSAVRRQFPGWRIVELSADPDMEHSLSANYPRGLLRQGKHAIAFIGAADGPAEPAHALTYGLVWLDYLRRREASLVLETLALFLPEGALRGAALRLKWLQSAQFALYTLQEGGLAAPVDTTDLGNLNTELFPPQARIGSALHPDAEEVSGRLRFRGLDVPDCSVAERPRMIAELEQMRGAGALDRLNPLYVRNPEGWLETRVRADLQTVDATLLPAPVYGQVTAIAGVDRGIADLVAVDRGGRLAVIEIKAGEDIHLPLQALDYWIRVAHHAENGDFTRNGYFPGCALAAEAPRLLLVAPALAFHPTTETVLRFFSSKISVERVGLGLEWRQATRVLLRLRGSERPA